MLAGANWLMWVRSGATPTHYKNEGNRVLGSPLRFTNTPHPAGVIQQGLAPISNITKRGEDVFLDYPYGFTKITSVTSSGESADIVFNDPSVPSGQIKVVGVALGRHDFIIEGEAEGRLAFTKVRVVVGE